MQRKLSMTLHYVIGDPIQTTAQTLAIGHNARGQTETTALHTHLRQRYPVAFAAYAQQCRKGRITAGTIFIWPDSTPRLLFMAVRDSSVGATRLRYIQSIALALARDYQREGIRSLVLAPLGQPHEWNEIKQVLETWLSRVTIPVIVYDDYVPGLKAQEPDLSPGQ